VSEVQLRLAATEAFLNALLPWLEEDVFNGVRALLRADLIAARGNYERLVYLNALRILDEMRRRLP
jgi:hypothetical protein